MVKAIDLMIYATGGSPTARIRKYSRGEGYFERRKKKHAFDDTSTYISRSSSSSILSKSHGEKHQEHREQYIHHGYHGRQEYDEDQDSYQSYDPYERESYLETGSKSSSPSQISSPARSAYSDSASDHVARNSESSVYSYVSKSQGVRDPAYEHGSFAGNDSTGYAETIASSHSSHSSHSTSPQARRSSNVSYKVDPNYYQSTEYANAVQAARDFSSRSSFKQRSEQSDYQTVIPIQSQHHTYDNNGYTETAFFSSASHPITGQVSEHTFWEDDHRTLAPGDSVSKQVVNINSDTNVNHYKQAETTLADGL
ncbi:hypothetical protein GGR57DRAFT_498555 [Xylariaceae sp. FL1272]|nr:hypothetical protein GGR57DRAFT_498555 [Xylariaceae sp. FL1272]